MSQVEIFSNGEMVRLAGIFVNYRGALFFEPVSGTASVPYMSRSHCACSEKKILKSFKAYLSGAWRTNKTNYSAMLTR